MNSRIAISATLTIALGLLLAPSRLALADKSLEGQVVSVEDGVAGADGKLVLRQKDSTNEDTYMLASTVKISLDKKKVELKVLKKGDAVNVTAAASGRLGRRGRSRECGQGSHSASACSRWKRAYRTCTSSIAGSSL